MTNMTREEYNAYQRDWRRRHKDKQSEYQKRYKAAHPDRVKAQKERVAEKLKAERRKLREAIIVVRTPEQQRKHDYYLKHKEEYIARDRERKLNMNDEERQKNNKIHRISQAKHYQKVKLAKELGII